jgi:hypothetical protein
MNNVIQFPSKGVRDWTIIERSLKSGLAELEISDSVARRINDRMKSFYEFCDPDFNFSLDFDFEISGSMSEQQKALFRSRLSEKVSAASEEKIQAFTKKLFFERLDCEINFCRELGLI